MHSHGVASSIGDRTSLSCYLIKLISSRFRLRYEGRTRFDLGSHRHERSIDFIRLLNFYVVLGEYIMFLRRLVVTSESHK